MTNFVSKIAAVAALSFTVLGTNVAWANDALSDQFTDTIAHIRDHGISVVPSSDGGSLLVLQTDFTTKDDPELRVLLGKDGMFAPDTDLGQLSYINGLQVFRTPSSMDISGFNEVYLWNPQNNVVVGVAPLE